MTNAQKKLNQLAEACSDLVYGGELGWRRVDFDQFVADVRKQLAVSGSSKEERKRVAASDEDVS
jgi:hypothetical protein